MIITIIMHLLISQHKITKHFLDIKVLFISAFWNRNNTVTNNTAQNNNSKKNKVHLFYWN